MLGEQLQGPWDNIPVTIIDYKRSKLIAKLKAKEISVGSKPPKEPGLYVMRPFPIDDDKAVLEYLLRVWEQENHGLYFDEILDLGKNNRGFRRLLSQGREKNCPMIYCTQRPRHIDQYALTEADFLACFHLTKVEDIKTIDDYAPGFRYKLLPRYYSWWYDVIDNEGVVLRPAPPEPVILGLYAQADSKYVNETNPVPVALEPGVRRKVIL